MDELGGHINLEGLDIDCFVDDKLEEEFVDALNVGPGRVHFILLFYTCFTEAKVRFLDVRQGSEDVALNHLHHFIEVGNDKSGHVLLVSEHLLELIDGVEPLSLKKALSYYR